MKRYFFLLLFSLSLLSVQAQEEYTHKVERGETYESIAERFGMTVQELKQLNPDRRYLYAGITITVRDYRGGYRDGGYDDRIGGNDGYADNYDEVGSESTNNYISALMNDPRFQEAQRLEQYGKYKDAAKIYTKMIDHTPTAPLFFARGVCYYSYKKWKNAIEDFERVIHARDATDALVEQSERYLDYAHEQREEAKERRANMWAGIIAGAVAVGVAADALSGSNKGHRGNDRSGGGKGSGRDGKKGQGGPQAGQGGQGGSPQAGQGGGRGGDRPQAGQGGGRGGNRSQAGQGGGRGGDRPQAGQGGGRGGDRQRGPRSRRE